MPQLPDLDECSWTLSKRDPHAVPNARSALALLRITRRLKGSFPEHNFGDLGSLIAPVLRRVSHAQRNLLSARMGAREGGVSSNSGDLSFSCSDASGFSYFLGCGLARGDPFLRPLFDEMEEVLDRFVRTTVHSSDKNLEILTRLLRLTPPDVAFLQLAMALSQGSFDRNLFCFVDTRTKIMRVLPALAGGVTPTLWGLFDLNRPLARSGLLVALQSNEVDWELEGLLRLSSLGARLLHTPYKSQEEMSRSILEPLVDAAGAAPLRWSHLAKQEGLLEAALSQTLAERRLGVNILLYGAPGTGKTAFARQLIERIGAAGFAVADYDQNNRAGNRAERLFNLQLCQTFAGDLGRVALVLDEAEDIFISDYNNPLGRIFSPGSNRKAWMNRLLETNRHPVIWISNQIDHLDPAYLRRFTFCLEFPRMPLSVRQLIAETHLGPAGCSEELISEASANDGLAPALLASAAQFATMARGSEFAPDVAVRVHLREQLKAMGREVVSNLPRRSTRFDLGYLNIEGNASPERVLAALPAARRATILFAGPPGTGKTQLAAEIAEVLNRELVYRTAADINSMWYGESERNVGRLFRECDPETQVLFVDEAESLLGSRDATDQRADRAVTAEFLRRIEAFEGVFICATNYSAILDAALHRRFMFRLNFRALDAKQRYAMFCETALGWKPGDGGDMPELGVLEGGRLARLDQLTPGDFANVVNRVRALDLALSPAQWLEELEAEHAAKPDGARSTLGFV